MKAGSRAVLTFVASEAGQVNAPKGLATSPGREPRLWGPRQASCPFVQCWLQEFLDPLPKLHAGCPLKMPGEGFGSSGSVRLQLLEECSLGCKALFGWARYFLKPPPHTAWQWLSLSSYFRTSKVPSKVKYCGPVQTGMHHRHMALARGESTVS